MQSAIILTTISKSNYNAPSACQPRIMDFADSPRECRLAVKKIVEDFKAYGDEYAVLFNETTNQARIENEHEIVFVRATPVRIKLKMSID